jgi:hypothetical protein
MVGRLSPFGGGRGRLSVFALKLPPPAPKGDKVNTLLIFKQVSFTIKLAASEASGCAGRDSTELAKV